MSVLPVEETQGNAALSLSVFIGHRFSTDLGSLHLHSHAFMVKKATVVQMLFVGQAANNELLYLQHELLPARSRLTFSPE